jgi:hypothetical protein
MKRRPPGIGSHPRRVVSVPSKVELLAYALSDGQWQRLREHIPDQLAPAAETNLRASIDLCCKYFLDHCRALRDGEVTARAQRSPGKGDAPLEQLAKSLRKAAIAWAEMGGDTAPNFAAWLDRLRAVPRLKEVGPWEDHDFHWPFEIGMSPAEAIELAIKLDDCTDEEAREQLCKSAAEQQSFERHKRRTAGKFYDDHRGPLSDLGSQLDALAFDAERRLKALKDLGELVTMTPRPQLVRAVKKCLKDAGLRPTATKRVYASADDKSKSGDGKPTWFQKFMAELNKSVLGIDGWGELKPGDLAAFYSEIAKFSGRG